MKWISMWIRRNYCFVCVKKKKENKHKKGNIIYIYIYLKKRKSNKYSSNGNRKKHKEPNHSAEGNMTSASLIQKSSSAQYIWAFLWLSIDFLRLYSFCLSNTWNWFEDFHWKYFCHNKWIQNCNKFLYSIAKDCWLTCSLW